jgi:hypothetical protein
MCDDEVVAFCFLLRGICLYRRRIKAWSKWQAGEERGCFVDSKHLLPLNVTIALRVFLYVYRIILIEGQATLYLI